MDACVIISKMSVLGRVLWRFTNLARCIWKLFIFLSQNSAFVRAIDVGEQLGFTKPSVSRAMSILKKDGYVLVDSDGAIKLTKTGLEIAQTMYTRHTVLSEMLMRLGVDEKTATEDACRIEHVISAASFSAIQQHVKQSLEKKAKE